MNAEECFETLKKSGWFGGWPEAALESAKATIRENKNLSGPENFVQQLAEFPAAAMISVWGDAECICEDDSYTKILQDFISGSHGFFQATDIQEVWRETPDGGFTIGISFRCHSKIYARTLEYLNDWLDEAVFDLINEAVADCDTPLCFHMPNIGFGQDFGFLLIPKGLVESAIEQGILPPLEEDWDSYQGSNDPVMITECAAAGDVKGKTSSFTILDFYTFAKEAGEPELFEETYGILPEHLVYFLHGDLDRFSMAIDQGADINAVSEGGILTALLIAVCERNWAGLEWLLQHPDLNLDTVDADGDTALGSAIERFYNDVAKRLIQAGANVHVVNHAGKNLVEFATNCGNTEMAELLRGMAVGCADKKP